MVRKLLSSCGLTCGSSNEAVTPLLLVPSLESVQDVLLWAGKEVQARPQGRREGVRGQSRLVQPVCGA